MGLSITVSSQLLQQSVGICVGWRQVVVALAIVVIVVAVSSHRNESCERSTC